ncbi:MAG: methyltransferase domain-containing protein [Acidihalobacter sp.]|jgi:ubiquinone/menaquinone biosynthesis C-methylase UbiE|uniref:class I SAM-dependent methyltransferase n=1 Tax=Acidihalobacter sp. TaxID=1872108 RepID=UPI00307FC308
MSAYAIAALLVLFVSIALVWRLASRRQSLPCPSWLSWLVEVDNPFTKTNRAATIIAHLGVEPGMRVLDAGCGPGRLSLPLARAVGAQGEVVALDVQAGMLRKVGDKAAEQGLDNIRFIESALEDAPLDAAQFDRALLVTVLGEIPDQAAALTKLCAVLKPGGVLSITEIVFDPHFQTRRHVTRLAETAGLRERDFFGNRIAYTLHFEKPLANRGD